MRTSVPITGPSFGTGYAVCPAGQRATGGGAGWLAGGIPGSDTIVSSGPTDSSQAFDLTITGDVPDRWYGILNTTAAGVTTGYVFAICQ